MCESNIHQYKMRPNRYKTTLYSEHTLSLMEKNGTAEMPGKALWVAAW